MARPSKYSKALADKICARIAEGESLVRICKDPKMPHRSTVLKWRGENDEFSDKYAHAYEMGADKAFEEMEMQASSAASRAGPSAVPSPSSRKPAGRVQRP